MRTARLLVDAGFDVLELHMAHSYLLSSFLAPGLNRRDDEYGGPLADRARLARQVARAVRDEVGDDAAITAKVSVSDGFKGGVTTEAGLEFARLLESDGTLDALQLSGGSSLMNPMYLFRGDAPREEFAAAMPFVVRHGMRLMGGRFLKTYPFEEAYFRDKALRFREELTMSLMLLGGINRARHHAARDGRWVRVRRDGTRAAARARSGQPVGRGHGARGRVHPLQPLHAHDLRRGRHPLHRDPGRAP